MYEYPPSVHVDDDHDKHCRVIEALKFATLVSRTEDDVIITQLPLILHRHRGVRGVLVGHMDRSNPQAACLDGRPVTAVFPGPDSYISPKTYQSRQLPTWNYLTVQVRGIVRRVTSTETLIQSLIDMVAALETGPEPYVLKRDNAQMLQWLNRIVGFEIEIHETSGRFKLSQDKSPIDRELARTHLLQHFARGREALVNLALAGLDRA